MSIAILEGGEKLSGLLAALATALATIPATQFLQGNQSDAFHEAVVAYSDTSDDADESSHLAFSLVVLDSPVFPFDRHVIGGRIRTSSTVAATLSYRLRDHDDGNVDGRLCLRACWQICRVIAQDAGGWTSDDEVSITLVNRGKLIDRRGSWLRYEIRFNLEYSEVL